MKTALYTQPPHIFFSKRVRLRETVCHFLAAGCSTSHYKHYSLLASAYVKYLQPTKFLFNYILLKRGTKYQFARFLSDPMAKVITVQVIA